MADVRSMLRAERTARRVEHEDARYTPGGMLMCNVCELPIKSDSLWPKHIQSKAHRLQAQRKRENAIPAPNNKKRKAADEEESERKKSKPEDLHETTEAKPGTEAVNLNGNQPSTATLEDQTIGDESRGVDTPSDVERKVAVSEPVATATVGQATSNEDQKADIIDEDEWAAFEREVATPPSTEHAPVSALNTTATIEAAPISAEELAARAREEASTQRGQRDEEVEAEKEDAARQLEEELDEMESYEERVRKLKEKREALRKNREQDQEPINVGILDDTGTGEPHGSEETDDDEEYEDDWGGWYMRVG